MTSFFRRAVTLVMFGALLFVYLRFFLLVSTSAINLPIWDDFDSALFFVNQFLEAPTFGEKLALLWAQHNEHRILINKTLTLLSLVLFSEVNFIFLIYCAVAALISIPFFLAVRSRDLLPCWLIAAAFLLQPQYGDGLNWVTTCLASFTLAMLAIACPILAVGSTKAFLFSLLLLVLAGFAQGNGIVLPFCLTLALLLSRHYKRAAIVLLTGAGIIFLYFQHYFFSERGQKISDLLSNLPLVFEYGFTIVGASLGFSDPTASYAAGVVLSLLLLPVLLVPQFRKNTPYVSFLLFLFLSAALNTAARCLSGSQYALGPGRYTILSSGIVATYMVLFYQAAKGWVGYLKPIMVVSALSFNIFSYRGYQQTVYDLHFRAINDLAIYLLFHQGLTYPWPDRGVPIFDASLKNHTFHLPITEIGLDRKIKVGDDYSKPAHGDIRIRIDRAQIGPEYIVIEGWGFMKSCPSRKTTALLQLHNQQGKLTLSPLRKPRGDLEGRFTNADRGKAGFISIFPKSYLENGDLHQVDVLLACDGKKVRQPTRYQLSREHVVKENNQPMAG